MPRKNGKESNLELITRIKTELRDYGVRNVWWQDAHHDSVNKLYKYKRKTDRIQ